MKAIDRIKGAFLGQGIGDALGVPVEFESRDHLKLNPVRDYLGYMCWNQPAGTFSDDSSMTYCTAESLCEGYNLEDIADRFVRWYKKGYWGAHDKLFDIGGTTRSSLDRIFKGESPRLSGEFFEENNGNGSLMRIMPLAFFLLNFEEIESRFQIVKEVSAITHAHFRSIFACFIFVEFLRTILIVEDREESYHEMQKSIKSFVKDKEFNPEEIRLFDRILEYNIADYSEDSIYSKGYVLDSLESSIWCFLTTNDFRTSVLKSVNLGGDTDTTGAINGGLAGLYYGVQSIPKNWITGLVKTDKISNLAERFKKTVIK